MPTFGTANFDADLAAAVDANLGANQSILFTPDDGDLAGKIFVVVDGNGDGAYTVGADYVFQFTAPLHPIANQMMFI